jgi:hypothetical protein
LTFKPVNIMWGLESLASPDPLDVDFPFYIPLTGFRGIETKEYKVLAAFGPRSFSFRNSKGTEFKIPSKATDEDPLHEAVKKESVTRLFVYEKPVREAVKDWIDLKKTAAIRMDLGERAAGQRAHVFMGKQKGDIWNKLKDLASRELLKRDEGEVKLVKRSYVEAFGAAASLDSFEL